MGHADGSSTEQVAGTPGPPALHRVCPGWENPGHGHADHTILVWKVPTLKAAEAAAGNPTPRQLQDWWTDLASADASAAHQAGGKLLLHPGPAVRLLREQLKPAVAVDLKQVRSLIAELDSDDFAIRDRASRRLEVMGDLAEPALRQALQAPPSLEMRKRLETLLDLATGLSPRYCQAMRALTILEQLGSSEARQVLEAVAQGVPAARVTATAQACLRRLAIRSPKEQKPPLRP